MPFQQPPAPGGAQVPQFVSPGQLQLDRQVPVFVLQVAVHGFPQVSQESV